MALDKYNWMMSAFRVGTVAVEWWTVNDGNGTRVGPWEGLMRWAVGEARGGWNPW
jgi:hypothetical protein